MCKIIIEYRVENNKAVAMLQSRGCPTEVLNKRAVAAYSWEELQKQIDDIVLVARDRLARHKKLTENKPEDCVVVL